MYKLFFFTNLFIVFFLTDIQCQNPSIELIFNAKYQENYLPLDSIHIQNLTKECDTMLYYPDSILILDVVSGLNDLIKSSESYLTISQNIPNPFSKMTTFNVFVAEKGTIEIHIRNLIGHVVAYDFRSLEAGTHVFKFYPGNDKFYVLSLFFNGLTQSIKMLNNSNFQGEICSLVYSELKDSHPINIIGSTNDFLFSFGDQLIYRGYADTPTFTLGSSEIEDSPNANQKYTFDILEGIRCPGTPTVTDIVGNTYNTVLIGSQCWMKENLKTTKYNNGIDIDFLLDDDDWAENTTGAYIWYNGSITWKDLYGGLYNWHAVNNSNGICPEGWQIPNSNDWSEFSNYIDGNIPPNGNKLKSCRQINSPLGSPCDTFEQPRWEEYQYSVEYGTDYFGFSGLPGGTRSKNGPFGTLGHTAYFWSSSESSAIDALFYYLFYGWDILANDNDDKHSGYSIRCIKN